MGRLSPEQPDRERRWRRHQLLREFGERAGNRVLVGSRFGRHAVSRPVRRSGPQGGWQQVQRVLVRRPHAPAVVGGQPDPGIAGARHHQRRSRVPHLGLQSGPGRSDPQEQVVVLRRLSLSGCGHERCGQLLRREPRPVPVYAGSGPARPRQRKNPQRVDPRDVAGDIERQDSGVVHQSEQVPTRVRRHGERHTRCGGQSADTVRAADDAQVDPDRDQQAAVRRRYRAGARLLRQWLSVDRDHFVRPGDHRGDAHLRHHGPGEREELRRRHRRLQRCHRGSASGPLCGDLRHRLARDQGRRRGRDGEDTGAELVHRRFDDDLHQRRPAVGHAADSER